MSAKELWLVVHFTAKEDKVAELVKNLRILVAKVQQEKGCLKYDTYQDARNPLAFTMIEQWASTEDWEAHNVGEALKWWGPVSKELREPQVTIQLLRDLP